MMPVAGRPWRASTRTMLEPRRPTSSAISRERSDKVATPSRYRVDGSASSPRRPGSEPPIRAGVTLYSWATFLRQIHLPSSFEGERHHAIAEGYVCHAWNPDRHRRLDRNRGIGRNGGGRSSRRRRIDPDLGWRGGRL